MCGYICCMLFNGFPNEAIQLKLPAAMSRESECVLCQYGQTCLHRGSQSAEKKHPTGSMFTCSKSSLPLSLSLCETELVSFILCYLLIPIQVHRAGAAATLACTGSKAGQQFIIEIAKTNTFTPIYIWGFSVPTRLVHHCSTDSHPLLHFSLYFISIICCTYIKWIVFYNNWFFSPSSWEQCPQWLMNASSSV